MQLRDVSPNSTEACTAYFKYYLNTIFTTLGFLAVFVLYVLFQADRKSAKNTFAEQGVSTSAR